MTVLAADPFWVTYSAVVATLAMLASLASVGWHFVKEFRSRRRLRVDIRPALSESVHPDAQGFHRRYYMVLYVFNDGGTEEVVRGWGVTGVKGTLVVDQGGVLRRSDGTKEGSCFPVRLRPGEYVEIELYNWSVLRKGPKRIYVEHGRGGKKYMRRADVRQAIRHAKEMDEANAQREPGPPSLQK